MLFIRLLVCSRRYLRSEGNKIVDGCIKLSTGPVIGCEMVRYFGVFSIPSVAVHAVENG